MRWYILLLGSFLCFFFLIFNAFNTAKIEYLISCYIFPFVILKRNCRYLIWPLRRPFPEPQPLLWSANVSFVVITEDANMKKGLEADQLELTPFYPVKNYWCLWNRATYGRNSYVSASGLEIRRRVWYLSFAHRIFTQIPRRTSKKYPHPPLSQKTEDLLTKTNWRKTGGNIYSATTISRQRYRHRQFTNCHEFFAPTKLF